ncbi:hypothetical protein L1887_51484 [Cichorium endivia]|nr:hypothetical protein L1887_51484 [Cichorium endivia]
MQVKGHVYYVTGGASGLGAATAAHLHALGAYVSIMDLQLEQGQKLADDLNARGGGDKRAAAFEVDVCDEAAVQAAISGSDKLWPNNPVGGCVNCGGVVPLLGQQRRRAFSHSAHGKGSGMVRYPRDDARAHAVRNPNDGPTAKEGPTGHPPHVRVPGKVRPPRRVRPLERLLHPSRRCLASRKALIHHKTNPARSPAHNRLENIRSLRDALQCGLEPSAVEALVVVVKLDAVGAVDVDGASAVRAALLSCSSPL